MRRTGSRRRFAIVGILALAMPLVWAGAAMPAAWAGAERLVQAGHLVVVGGGGTPDDVVHRALELAGGAGAVVVVLAQASAREDAGESTVEMWRQAGAGVVTNVALDDAAAAVAAVEEADLVWMPGGVQTRLMEALRGTGVPEAIQRHYAAGGVAGGASAGAAVISAAMITGEADLESIRAGTIEVVDGLGLWPEVIVDHHFLARRRVNRLIAAVLDRPHLVGVGIDERTAVIVGGSSFEVVGQGTVMVIDAREAEVAPTDRRSNLAARGVRLHILRAGMTFDLDR